MIVDCVKQLMVLLTSDMEGACPCHSRCISYFLFMNTKPRMQKKKLKRQWMRMRVWMTIRKPVAKAWMPSLVPPPYSTCA